MYTCLKLHYITHCFTIDIITLYLLWLYKYETHFSIRKDYGKSKFNVNRPKPQSYEYWSENIIVGHALMFGTPITFIYSYSLKSDLYIRKNLEASLTKIEQV